MTARFRKAMTGGLLLPTLPARLAALAAVRWLERLHDHGTANAVSVLALRDAELHDFDVRFAALSLPARVG